MADDAPTISPTASRPKPSRTATGATIRGRASPPSGQSGEGANDGRPPAKRARKAINCEPCRNSKLKCDRNRPCSSCVLRGTSAMCYQDGRGPAEGTDPLSRGDEPSSHIGRIDPVQEIYRLRHSVNLLEAYIFPAQRNLAAHRRASDAAAILSPKKEPDDASDKVNNVPGMLGSSVQGGLYAGPTSAATHLLNTNTGDSEEAEHGLDQPIDETPVPPLPASSKSTDGGPIKLSTIIGFDHDLLDELPPTDIVDQLINYYFEYCNWIYRHINEPSFRVQWEKYKEGAIVDRLAMAAACTMIAIAFHYLPANHPHLGYDGKQGGVGSKYYNIATQALQRRRCEDSRAYSLELVELLLCRCHYLTLSKTDSEEIWQVRGELVTIGMAMGLHRDPGRWKMHRDLAERRRWAWWHIILLERWQAFMLGRPLAIASHHFDTHLPSHRDPERDKGRLYLPNIALFQLAFILGDIMDDAVSVRHVPYENVTANDRALTQWMESLPPELDLDEYQIARSLASPNINQRRLGVQSIIIRTSYYHIRFTLHRPYTNAAGVNAKANVSAEKQAQSLSIAVSAADKLITMVGQSRPDFLANSSLAVPGHMNWGPFHCFSAAMFFTFQLITNPDQPGAGLFRQNIAKAIDTLAQCEGELAEKAYKLLNALSPLYSPEFLKGTPEERAKWRSEIMGVTKNLAFPYHDSHDPRRFADSPSTKNQAASPANSSSVSPPLHMMQAVPQQQYESLPAQIHMLSSMRAQVAQPQYQQHSPQYQQHPQQQQQQQHQHQRPHHQHQHQVQPYHGHVQAMSQSPQTYTQPQSQFMNHHQSASAVSTSYQQSNPAPQFSSLSPQAQQQMFPEMVRFGVPYADQLDSSIWGAAVGFVPGEWSHLMGSDGANTNGFKQELSSQNRHVHS